MVALLLAAILAAGNGDLRAMREECSDKSASGASGVQLCEVPRQIPEPMRSELVARRAAIVREIDRLNELVDQFNTTCGAVSATDTEARARCQRDFDAYNQAARTVEASKLNFNEQVREAMRRGLKITEPPPPAVLREEATLRDDPRQWLRDREQDVRRAVRANAQWTARVLRRLEEPRTKEPQYEVTRSSELGAGDVILVAPPNERLNPTGAAGSQVIRFGDAAYRVFAEAASGRTAAAARQGVEPPSHALTYLGVISGVRMYYSEDIGGSRIIDERQFLRDYGAREMYVARPQAVVDGRRLWKAARDATIRNPDDYGCVGDGKYTCAERTGIVVAQATGMDLSTHRVGPIDVTPGDFFDREGNVGKHFVITRLRIDGVQR